jgi:hypothetical protein
MQKMVCDLCGKEIPNYVFDKNHAIAGYGYHTDLFFDKDLCNDCMDRLKNYIKLFK